MTIMDVGIFLLLYELKHLSYAKYIKQIKLHSY